MADRMILVEGSDDQHAIRNLLNAHPGFSACLYKDWRNPPYIAVQGHEGFEDLRSKLPDTLRLSSELTRAAIVVDHDSPEHQNRQVNRWRSLRDLLRRAFGAQVPEEPVPEGWIGEIAFADKVVKAGIWLMPDNVSEGALEEFAISLIAEEDELWQYATDCVDGLPKRRFDTKDESKALIHTWLAWQRKPRMPIGRAISKGVLDPRKPAVEPFVEWARRLFEV